MKNEADEDTDDNCCYHDESYWHILKQKASKSLPYTRAEDIQGCVSILHT